MCSQFVFPKPRDWEALEDIVADALKRRYQSPNLQRFGRRGQKQFGIDIVGPTKVGVLGIQCKHHAEQDIPISEVDATLNEARKFPVPISELIIATSANRDTKAHSYVLALSESRRQQGECSVSIVFWEDIVEWLEEFPDLLYKHFTKHFPSSSFERIEFPNLIPKKRSVSWPATAETIHQVVLENLQGVEPVDPYQLAIEINSFSDLRFTGLVDIELQLTQPFPEQLAQRNFLADVETFRQLKTAISTPQFSKELLVCLQTRLTTGFLFGWMFRRVTGFSPQLVVGDELWVTNGLPSIKSGLYEMPPVLLSNDSREVALVLSLSRHIGTQVHSSIDGWPQKPRVIIELRLEGNSVRNSAQALSVAKEVAWRIKTYVDQWQAERIHLFAAVPIGLAPLITYHLNAICPIDLYFLDSNRAHYLRAGTITNNLGGDESWQS
jgi:hypothetical protein